MKTTAIVIAITVAVLVALGATAYAWRGGCGSGPGWGGYSYQGAYVEDPAANAEGGPYYCGPRGPGWGPNKGFAGRLGIGHGSGMLPARGKRWGW